MNRFDKVCRRLARLTADGFLAWQLGSQLVFKDWLDTRSTPEPEERDLTGDTIAALVESGVGPWWAVPIEFQTQPDPEMFGRALEMLGRTWRGLRPPGGRADRFQVGMLVVNLTGRGNASRDMQIAGLHTQLKVVECNLSEIEAIDTRDRIANAVLSRCVLPWVPLMQGGCEVPLIEHWKALAEAEPDKELRLTYAACALIFAELSGCGPTWKIALEDWNVTESQTVLEFIAEGEVKTRAADILETLQIRFPNQTAPELIALIRGTKDRDCLMKWFRAALTAATADDFAKGVRS